MNLLFSIFIFIIIIIFYLNIIKQLKIGDDLVIYEMDYSSNQNLQEICDLNQPFSFDFAEFTPNMKSDILNGYDSYDINIIDLNDYLVVPVEINPIPLSLKNAKKLMNSASGSHYISENNEEFIEETELKKEFRRFDEFMKPTFTVQTKYDYLFGAKNANTILKYHTNYRKFLYVISGKVRIKMTSWNYTKYLQSYKDYEHYEFRSPINLFSSQEKYGGDYEKIKTIDFELNPGYVLFIPPYWWYSIQYLEDSTNLGLITYNTIMNQIVNISNTTLYFLQQQNISKPKIARKIEILEEKVEERVEISGEPEIKDSLPTEVIQ